MESKEKFIVTFGDNQLPGINYYTIIYAKNVREAGEKMNSITTKWAFIYLSEDDAGVEEHNLKLVNLEEVIRMVAAAKLY